MDATKSGRRLALCQVKPENSLVKRRCFMGNLLWSFDAKTIAYNFEYGLSDNGGNNLRYRSHLKVQEINFSIKKDR